MRYRFLQFETAELTKRIGLPPGEPDFKLVTPQTIGVTTFVKVGGTLQDGVKKVYIHIIIYTYMYLDLYIYLYI